MEMARCYFNCLKSVRLGTLVRGVNKIKMEGGPMESILTSIKSLLGISEDTTAFDGDVLAGINAAFFTLTQLGIGPPEGFLVTDSTETWSDFYMDRAALGGIKQYVFLKTKLAFDPPDHGYVMTQYESIIKELEWRLNEQREEERLNESGRTCPGARRNKRNALGRSKRTPVSS